MANKVSEKILIINTSLIQAGLPDLLNLNLKYSPLIKELETVLPGW